MLGLEEQFVVLTDTQDDGMTDTQADGLKLMNGRWRARGLAEPMCD